MDYELELEGVYDEVEKDWVHKDDLPDYDHAKNMLESITNAVYETGDTEQLEDCLEELLACFDIKIPNKKPLLEKLRKNKTNDEKFIKFVI